MQAMFLPGFPAELTPLPLGTITDPSGHLAGQIEMPRLPTGIDGLVLFTQLGVISSGGRALLGSGSAVVWLSASSAP